MFANGTKLNECLRCRLLFVPVSVGRVVAELRELRSSVLALMVFARSLQFSDNIFAINLHKEKICVSSETAMRKRAGYYLCSREEAGICRTLVIGNRLFLVAEYW